MDKELKTHLQRQLSFLHNSSNAFDAGEQEESLRIATAIRVLVHQTAKSEALFNQMDVRTSIQLLSTVEKIGPNVVLFDGPVAMAIWSDRPGRILPKLSCGDTRLAMTVDAWWTQVVCVHAGHHMTRREIVLGAANKDGGAHVDVADVPENFALLQAGVWATGRVEQGEMSGGARLSDHHFAMLRQFAFELLNSDDLLALAGDTPPA